MKVSAIDEGEERGELDIDGETRNNGGRGVKFRKARPTRTWWTWISL